MSSAAALAVGLALATAATSAPPAPLEVVAGSIASQIAGRPVTVRCESDGDWAALAAARGGDPGGENGFVASTWNTATGDLVGVSSTIELSGSGVCAPLQRFAAAAAKQATCRSRRRNATPCYAPRLDYLREATALLTLAHESVHAGGVVGGRLSSGMPVGDEQAEAKAECYGLQWVPLVAERLGDSASDARSVASYVWNQVYAPEQTTAPAYWSADCRPGGPLDVRPAGALQAWP